MTHRKTFFLAGVLVVFLFCSILSAKVPNRINYQGKLTTASGGCVNDTVQMTFSIYPDTLGSPAIWTETQTQVVIKDGVFSVLLGDQDSLPFFVFDGSTRYLGIKVESDPEMRPLRPMVSVAYAFHSVTADTAFHSVSDALMAIDSVYNPGGNVDLVSADAIIIISDDENNTITIGETHSGRTDNPHLVTAAQTGALVSVEGVNNPGGNVDLIPENSITVVPNDGANTITIGETHSGRTDNPHLVTAAQTGALVSIEGVNNAGGNVDLIPENSITIASDDGANTINIGETHSGRTDNPHVVTAQQTGALVSLDGVNNPGGDIDLIAGDNMTITPNPSNRTITFSAASAGGWTDDGTVVRLDNGTDSVGIGTTTPEAILHVRSSSGTGSIRVESGTGVKGGFSCYDTYSRIGTDTNHDFIIGSNGVSRIWVKTDGRVGIGTNSPTQSLDVAGTIQATGIIMPPGASNGKVLTSDALGVGTWQTPSGGLDGSGTTNFIPKFTAATTLGNSVIYQNGSAIGIGTTNPSFKLTVGGNFFANTVNTGWGDNELFAMNQDVRTTDNPTFNQLNLTDFGTAAGGFHLGGTSDPGTGNLIVDGSIGVGTSNPAARLHVASVSDYSGYFTSNYPSASTRVLYSEFTGTGNYSAVSVYGRCIPADYFGIGGYFEGGYIGVEGRVAPTANHDYRGVAGFATGGSGVNYGVYGSASGGGTNIGVYYSGGLAGTGTKSCVVKTSKGPTLLYCQESPENWFEDFGEGQLVNGRAHVVLDQLFLETVTIDAVYPMKVFVQPEGDCKGVYVSKGTDGFDVIELNQGRSNVPFSYRVVAKRKGFENRRLDYTKAGENDPYLYPDTEANSRLGEPGNTGTKH
jgi:hypothetical protein